MRAGGAAAALSVSALGERGRTRGGHGPFERMIVNFGGRGGLAVNELLPAGGLVRRWQLVVGADAADLRSLTHLPRAFWSLVWLAGTALALIVGRKLLALG